MSEGEPDGGPTGDGGRDEPFGDLKRRLRARSEPDDVHEDGGVERTEGDVGAGADELFEEMDVTDVDAERVWESVLDDEVGDADGPPVDPSAGGPDETVGTGDTADAADAADADEEHVVRKRNHCESCECFTAPPEVACTDDDGEIVEVVDSERFRVRNCPVVAGRIDTDGTILDGSDGSVVDGFE
jgi:hypothetical protein